MARMTRQKRERLSVIVSVLVVAIIILLLPARLTAPARSVFTQAVGPAEDLAFRAGGNALAASGTLRDAVLSQDRERRMDQHVTELLNENAALEEKLREQESALSSAKELRLQSFAFTALSTRITAYDSDPMRQSITINAGTHDGVRKGLAVTSGGAVVGRVSETGPWVSRVLLITDAKSTISCRVSRTRDLCVLQGTGGVSCSVDWLSKDASVEPGDVLVTAPLDELLSEQPLIPAGIPVATISRTERPRKEPLFLGVVAVPSANVERLETVEVIIPATSQ